MNQRNLFFLFTTSFFLFAFSILAEFPDYLSIGKQLNFNREQYELKWSSHPTPTYYKQEYYRSGETPGHYHKMLLVEAVEGNLTVDDAVKSKALELQERKKWDYAANFQSYDNKQRNESILDFVVSDTGYFYEWNLYRFKQQKVGNKNYIVLFAYSYKDSLNDNAELKKFFDLVQASKQEMFNQLQGYPVPAVKPGNQ